MTTEPQIDPESLVARIITELQANPDAQRLLLRALLTNEFLGVPARLARIEQDIEELKSDVSQLKIDVAELKTDMSVVKTDVGALKGFALESLLHRRIRPIISQHFSLLGPRMIQSAAQEPLAEFTDVMATGVNDGVISQRQYVRVSYTDLIMRGHRRGDQTFVWVAIEASNKVDGEDIRRARETADILELLFEGEFLAVAVGYSIDQRDRDRADAVDVTYLEVSETW